MIRPATPKRAAELRRYNKEVKLWLALQRQMGVRCPVTGGVVTQAHHKYGRRRKLLMWRRGWVAVSFTGHYWITHHPREARKRGLIGPLGSWNKQELVTND